METRSTTLICFAVILCAAMGSFTPYVQATLLPAGATVVPSATTSPQGATLVADSNVQPFTSVDGTSFSGTLRTRVYMNDPANPFLAPLTLTFTFLLTNTGPDALERMVAIDYLGVTVDVQVNATLAPGAVPTSVDRSAGTGKNIGWDYTGGPGIAAGGSSALLVVHTNSVLFQHENVSIINGSVATVSSFGPNQLPEPGTIATASIGGICLLARHRRRTKRDVLN